MTFRIAIIGGGLAGSEAALQCAALLGPQCHIDLFEMRPHTMTPAHTTESCAELVCSNSLKSIRPETAHGCLKKMLEGHTFLFELARESAVPAGESLAVDRERFSQLVQAALRASEIIQIRRERLDVIPENYDRIIVATGPLTHETFCAYLQKEMGTQSLSFYDAIAPIVTVESLDLDRMYYLSRYENGPADFLNIPLTKTEYFQFVQDILAAEKVPLADFETVQYFESCLPIEVIAERGPLTLCHGPMSPMGLRHPKTGKLPFAVVQLRREDKFGFCYNLVGFQTKMKYPDQMRVFRSLPGMKDAEFVRCGSIHRNTYIHSPSQLHSTLQWKKNPDIFFAGQLTGAEGYSEAIATGFVAAHNVVRSLRGEPLYEGDRRELLGALLLHMTDSTLHQSKLGFQPMNLNFGIVDATELPRHLYRRRRERRLWLSERSVSIFQDCFFSKLGTAQAIVKDPDEFPSEATQISE